MDTLESAWAQMCRDAGWTEALCCTPDGGARAAYEHKLDALAKEREITIRALIAKEREHGTRFHRAYVNGVESALNRAISDPR
jgi:hypothetical protein